MTQTLKEMELAGWSEKASAYDLYGGKITQQAVEPLLNATGVEAGMQMLDIATGPGYVAGGAHHRGAIASGIDLAESMIAQAKSKFPDALFYEGDAESLIFPSEYFDVVTCSFGLHHLEYPEKALAAAFRVLKPKGRYGFTVWAQPKRHGFFGLVMDAITTHGCFDVPLPEAPDLFKFSDPDECRKVLSNSGFIDIEVGEIPINWSPTRANEALDIIYKSSVRTARLLELQNTAAQENIHQHILEQIDKVIKAGDEMSWPAVMAVATRPA